MACSLKAGLCSSGLNEINFNSRAQGVLGICSPVACLQFVGSVFKDLPTLSIDFKGKPLVVADQRGLRNMNCKAPTKFSVDAQASICISRAQRWWQKTLQPNMVEIQSAQELVDSLLNAGDRLVIVDFYSPGCGGCRTLHPKICQLADSNRDAIFLKVNYEELKTMCYSLHIHVLPFFRFYRGAEGRLCSFSCTNATIKKFKDALAKYGSNPCCPGPAKGLDESELLKLASAGEISIDSPLSSTAMKGRVEEWVIKSLDSRGSLSFGSKKMEINGGSAILEV